MGCYICVRISQLVTSSSRSFRSCASKYWKEEQYGWSWTVEANVDDVEEGMSLGFMLTEEQGQYPTHHVNP
jgi:hypothetical protein